MKKLCVIVLAWLALTAWADFQVSFPLSTDTWQVTWDPYWWNIGDTVYGTRSLGTDDITQIDLYLPLLTSVLADGGHVDIELRIGGATVASFVIGEADGLLVERTFDLSGSPFTPSGDMEIRFYETNLVASGGGSVSMNRAAGTLDFTSDWNSVVETSFGQIKARYQ